MTNKLTINYENPALIQFRLKKKSFSSFLKLVVVRLLRIVKGISFQVIGAWELIANRYLRDILCKLNENELDNHENYDLSGSKEREAGGRLFSVIRIQPKKHWDGIYRVNEGERIKSLETRRLRTCSWNRKGDNSCEREREKRRKTICFTLSRAYESCLACQTLISNWIDCCFGQHLWNSVRSLSRDNPRILTNPLSGSQQSPLAWGQWIRTKPCSKLTRPMRPCLLKLLFSAIVHEGVFWWRYNSVPLIRRLSVTPYTHACL